MRHLRLLPSDVDGSETLDISNRIDISSAETVCEEVCRLLHRYTTDPDELTLFFQRSFRDFKRLFSGKYPGYHGCDTGYHDLSHSLDVTLAMARLMDGHESSCGASKALGLERMKLGIVLALFHDSGYFRQKTETEYSHGAAYTKIHVSRSAKFLAHYLPLLGMADDICLAQGLVHYTGYEIEFGVPNALDHTLGCLLGTADLVAQMSGRTYLEKCRDDLFIEFRIGGVSKQVEGIDGGTLHYRDSDDLLVHTPGFMAHALRTRLEESFGGAYHYLDNHFEGGNLYMAGIEKNYDYIQQLRGSGDFAELRRQHI